jgi:putative colanic acid biosynthesis acetyltransferase WcaF
VPENPYLRAQTSLNNRIARAAWGLAWTLLCRLSPRPFHAWRSLILRCFGARIGRNCHIYPACTIWAPWNLHCEEGAAIADGAVIYNAAPVRLGVHAIVSQGAYICTASHDIQDPAFPMTSAPISIGDYAWICARASVLPGVVIETGAVLALGSVASKRLEAWHVYAGVPARCIGERSHQ